MSTELAAAPVNPGFHRATSTLSETLGIEPRMMVDTLKKQCFPNQRAEDISDTQLASFISVANALKLNPLVPGMLYAYPSKNGGMVPVTGPDGVFKMLDERISEGRLDGYECIVFPEDPTQKPTHATATIWRRGSEHPSKYTALISEWSVGSNTNWSSRPRHMLWVRALKQCARQVIHGIPFDEDEVTIGDLKDVTPVKRAEPKPRANTGAASVKENLPPSPADVPSPAPAPTPKGTVLDGELEGDPKATEPAKAEAPPEQVQPRAFLKPDERASFTVEITDVLTADLSPTDTTPVVEITVKGEFNGKARAIGEKFATPAAGPQDNPVALPIFTVGNKVRLGLHGYVLKSNKISNRVESVELAGGKKSLGSEE